VARGLVSQMVTVRPSVRIQACEISGPSYEGRLSTAGNLAFPFTPPEVTIREAYRFNIFHLMQVEDMARLFPVEVETVA